MSYLNPTLRASLQKAANRFLTDACTIEVASMTTGDLGQPVESWATVAANVPCLAVAGIA